ncbi:YqbF domain-containing protein [Bacillus halotolerans]|uniref:YqbF domain-containing protein n=1 Tax=Bacillus halotolerans TaxID=260554 RepID=UPI002DB684CE|nr:YqbF domain-containing protein [Bacillus halotolerans]MEC3639773.1 YqbF domain-containing protein [Bacillus halotolerans]
MYTAKLIQGKTYHVMDKVFKIGEEQPVSRKLYLYLKQNEAFEVNEVQGENNGGEEPIHYTEAQLKGMQKSDHETIIFNLGGNPSDFKNADERIAFILNQQENSGE